jgi:hypothetical protein
MSDLCVQVFSAIEAVKGSLGSAGNEIFVGRVMGSPFYLPRFLAAAVDGKHRQVPVEQASAIANSPVILMFSWGMLQLERCVPPDSYTQHHAETDRLKVLKSDH